METDEFTAAAPPDPDASGSGETSFADADVPPASQRAVAEVEDERDKYLALAQRTQADFENYRKRMTRENAAAKDRGVASVAKELLPALDHLEHALKAVEGPRGRRQGLRARTRRDRRRARARGHRVVLARGRAVRPQRARGDGRARRPRTHESGTVIEVYQRGYRLNGAILRPARVVVAE